MLPPSLLWFTASLSSPASLLLSIASVDLERKGTAEKNECKSEDLREQTDCQEIHSPRTLLTIKMLNLAFWKPLMSVMVIAHFQLK